MRVSGIVRLGVLLAGVTGCVSPALAAGVSGQVRARDGARLPRASIRLTDSRSGATWRTVSGELGGFAIANLPPGRYDLRVELAGFSGFTAPGIELAAEASTATIDAVLEIEAIHEVVQVIAGAPAASVESAPLRETGARDVGESIAAAAGAWQLRKGGLANEVVLRGLQSRDLNVLIDGQRTYGACPNHMDPPAFHVDLAEVERVEVDKGPFDVRHQGSLGGLVNVVTRRPESGWHGTLAIGLGAEGYANPSGTVSYGSGRVAMLGGASFRRADPYRSGDGRTFTEITNYAPASRASDAFSVATGWGKTVVTLGGAGRAQVSYTRQDASHVLYPYLMMDGIWDVTDRASVRYDRTTDGPIDALQAQMSFTRVDHWMTDEYRTSGAGTPRAWSMGTQADSATTGARVEATVDAFTTGVEATRRAWTASTLLAMRQYAAQASIPDVVIDTAGAFADWHRSLGSRASFEVGARIDYAASAADESLANTNLYDAYQRTRSTSRHDVLPAVKAGVSGQAGPVHLTLSAGHTTRVAEANERYYALQRMGTDWVGNPDLAPVRHTGLDVAATWTHGAASVAAQAYISRIADYITVYDQARVQMVPGVMNTMARSYANVDASLRGFELSASAPVRPGLALSGDVSYVRGWQDGDAARGITASPLAEMPALRGRARLRWDAARWYAQAEQVVTGDQNRVDAGLGEAPTPGAAVTNLSAGLRWRGVSVAAGVTNLFDRSVVDALSYQRDPFRTGVRLPEPGRQWFANVSWRY